MSGKGSKQRPTDKEAFYRNFDAISGKPDAESQKAMHTAAMSKISKVISL